jgi:processive 1,2-diacylglycerol beta-glucosyltransferase
MRTLILYSPAGNGHRAAATAVADAIARERPDMAIDVVDVLRFAPPAFRYDLVWKWIQQHGGAAYDGLFDLSNGPHPMWRVARERLNLTLLAPLVAEIERLQPERIVCTHFLPAIAVAGMARRGRLRGALSTVITDFASHEAWVLPGVARYFVATPQVTRQLIAHGVAPSSIAVTGIPLRAEMDEPRVPLDERGPLRVLFLAAGVPWPLVRESLASLRGRNLSLEIVAGSDREDHARLARSVNELGLSAKVHRFLPSLRPLLDRAQIVVTKAGGLVVSECFARGRGMVLPFPAPGQERGNRERAIVTGAAITLPSPSETGAALTRLRNARGSLCELARAAADAATPGAARRIARDLLRDLSPPIADERPLARAVAR